jgi:succinoglycan biosynthesis protein ExoA
MPIRNEAAHLRDSVAAVLAQEYPHPFQICLAVGPSTVPGDTTEAIAAQLAAIDERIIVVPNPAGTTPAALNAAIAALDPATSEVLVRVDGHATLGEGYITQAVRTLQATGAVNVGGRKDAVGETAFEQAVAVAMTSRFGTGGSRFHVGGEAGPVDSVPFGVFRRSALEAVGGFDERLIRNQDYELNIRLRNAGGTIWFDPQLRFVYRPRASLRALARQYWQYGWWKAIVARQHPGSLKARQIIPALATAALAVDATGLGGRLLGGRLLSTRVRRPVLFAYVLAVIAAAVTEGVKHRSAMLTLRLCVIYPVMHLSWGGGFIASMTAMLLGRNQATRR